MMEEVQQIGKMKKATNCELNEENAGNSNNKETLLIEGSMETASEQNELFANMEENLELAKNVRSNSMLEVAESAESNAVLCPKCNSLMRVHRLNNSSCIFLCDNNYETSEVSLRCD